MLVKSLYLLLQSQNCLPCQGFLFPRNTLHINEIKRVFIEVMSQAFRLTSFRSVDGCGVADLSSYLAFVLRKAEEKKNKEAFYMKLGLKKSVDLKRSCFFFSWVILSCNGSTSFAMYDGRAGFIRLLKMWCSSPPLYCLVSLCSQC